MRGKRPYFSLRTATGAAKRKIVVVVRVLVHPPRIGMTNKSEGGWQPTHDPPATHLIQVAMLQQATQCNAERDFLFLFFNSVVVIVADFCCCY